MIENFRIIVTRRNVFFWKFNRGYFFAKKSKARRSKFRSAQPSPGVKIAVTKNLEFPREKIRSSLHRLNLPALGKFLERGIPGGNIKKIGQTRVSRSRRDRDPACTSRIDLSNAAKTRHAQRVFEGRGGQEGGILITGQRQETSRTLEDLCRWREHPCIV